MYNKKTNGFTLVEIIVVLVIIAILAAITLPALTGYIEDSKEKVAFSEVLTYRTAAQTVASELYGNGCSYSAIDQYLFKGDKGSGTGSVPADYKNTVASLTGEGRYKDYSLLKMISFAPDSAQIKVLGMYTENGLYVVYNDGKMAVTKPIGG